MATTDTRIRTVRPAGPEDIRQGHYITVSRATMQTVGPACDSGPVRPQIHRLTYLPPHAGYPMRVISVCLPFVLVEAPDGSKGTLDLRQVEIVRLPRKYGQAAFDALAPKQDEQQTP